MDATELDITVQNSPEKLSEQILKYLDVLKIGQTLHITTRYVCKVSTICKWNCKACN